MKPNLRPLHLRSRSFNALDQPPSPNTDDGHEFFTVSPTYTAWTTDSPPSSAPGPHAISRSVSSPLLASRYHADPQPLYPPTRFDPRYAADLGVKPLSPITEQDYVSPERRSQPLPHDDVRLSTTTGSQYSGITRPSPTYSSFIKRPLNRSFSQTSSTSYLSAASSAPPSIPPLDLRPSFAAQLRAPRVAPLRIMPTINGSAEAYNGMCDDDGSSLPADIYMTADSIEVYNRPPRRDTRPFRSSGSYRAYHLRSPSITSQAPSARSTETSSTTSFFDRRWRRSESFGSGFALSQFPEVPKSPFGRSLTPAGWLFFLGFIAPWCWMIGGWYYTIRGQRRPRYREKNGKKDLILPMWVMTKKGLGGVRLTEKEAHSHGVWFGYPFVATALDNDGLTGGEPSLSSSLRSTPVIRTKRPRVLDPWIFRCRVATFVSGSLLTIGFIVAFVVLQYKSR